MPILQLLAERGPVQLVRHQGSSHLANCSSVQFRINIRYVQLAQCPNALLSIPLNACFFPIFIHIIWRRYVIWRCLRVFGWTVLFILPLLSRLLSLLSWQLPTVQILSATNPVFIWKWNWRARSIPKGNYPVHFEFVYRLFKWLGCYFLRTPLWHESAKICRGCSKYVPEVHVYFILILVPSLVSLGIY